MARRPTLFKRLPSLRWKPKVNEQIITQEVQGNYPAFTNDFAFLEKELLPYFQKFDNAALRTQNQFRLAQVTLIFGAALATTLGTIQTALEGQAWPGIFEAVVAIALTAVAQRARKLSARQPYYTDRLKAETLRGEYFLFLGRIKPYDDEQSRTQTLIRRVARVVAGGPSNE